MNVLVISCSLRRESRSAALATRAAKTLERWGVDVAEVDLRDIDLPLCDGEAAHDDPRVHEISARLAHADAVMLAAPVYNFYANAAAKNLIELTAESWSGKVVGFLCAAGGQGSYMSIMALANSLMLDFRCLIVPRFVYANRDQFDHANTPSSLVDQRIDTLCRELYRIADALRLYELPGQ